MATSQSLLTKRMRVRGATCAMLSGVTSRVTNTSGDGNVHLILRNAVKSAPAAPEMATLALHVLLARRALAHAPLMMAGLPARPSARKPKC